MPQLVVVVVVVVEVGGGDHIHAILVVGGLTLVVVCDDLGDEPQLLMEGRYGRRLEDKRTGLKQGNGDICIM